MVYFAYDRMLLSLQAVETSVIFSGELHSCLIAMLKITYFHGA